MQKLPSKEMPKFWADRNYSDSESTDDHDDSSSYSSSVHSEDVEGQTLLFEDDASLSNNDDDHLRERREDNLRFDTGASRKIGCYLDRISLADSINKDVLSRKVKKDQSQPLTENFLAKSSLEYVDDTLDPNLIWKSIRSTQKFEAVPKSLPHSSLNLTTSVTRIVCISDTHGRHRDIPFLPKGDVLIHGGDFTKSGETGTVIDLSNYFKENQPKFEHIICIAGNHELTFHAEFYATSERRHKPKPFDPQVTRDSLKNCTYLEDSSTTIYHDGTAVPIYGMPWTPTYYDWAYNLPRGQALHEVCALIPSSTDVLITHGPPLGRGDFTGHSGRAGCYDLLKHVQNRIRPRVHIFGHIHQGFGYSYDGRTLFVNASNLGWNNRPSHTRIVVIDLPHDQTLPATVVIPQCKIDTKQSLLQWFKNRDYKKLAKYILDFEDDEAEKSFPLGDDLLHETSFTEICDALHLHRDKEALSELKRALCEIYSESFG